jgi:hypothetical protein
MKLLTKHLNDVGETYFQHMKQALTISLLLSFLDKKLPANRKANGGE